MKKEKKIFKLEPKPHSQDSAAGTSSEGVALDSNASAASGGNEQQATTDRADSTERADGSNNR